MTILYKKNENLKLPVKANPSDTGFDVFAATEPRINGETVTDGLYKRVVYIEYGTGLFVKPINENFADWVSFSIDLRPRSSISKYNLLLCNPPATVDRDYRGEVLVRFKYQIQSADLRLIDDAIYNIVDHSRIYQKGDKICQLLAHEIIPVKWIEVDSLDETSRGEGGFGSSGQ